MKNIFYIIGFLIWSVSFVTGQIDFAVTGSGISPSQIAIGGNAKLETFTVINDLLGDPNTILSAGCLRVIISFDESKLSYLSPEAGTFSDNFDWVMVDDDALYGTSTEDLRDGNGGLITINFTSLVGGDVTVIVSTNLSDIGVPACAPLNDGTNDGVVSSVILPVEFTKFNIKSNECTSTNLVWETASEINNKGFEVQRLIGKGEYEVVGFVESKGNSGGSYSFVDKISTKLNEREILYRLKQIDNDGGFDFSQTQSAIPKCFVDLELSLSPNPATEKIQFVLDGAFGEEAEITVIDNTGNLVRSFKVVISDKTELNINDLPAGVYNANVRVANKTFNERFIKVK